MSQYKKKDILTYMMDNTCIENTYTKTQLTPLWQQDVDHLRKVRAEIEQLPHEMSATHPPNQVAGQDPQHRGFGTSQHEQHACNPQLETAAMAWSCQKNGDRAHP
jgi:hypothetical protein